MPDPRLRYVRVCEATPEPLRRRIQGYANGLYRAFADLGAGQSVDPERIAVTIRYLKALMDEMTTEDTQVPVEWLAWLDRYERRWDDPDHIVGSNPG